MSDTTVPKRQRNAATFHNFGGWIIEREKELRDLLGLAVTYSPTS